jgi:hypothetical protein
MNIHSSVVSCACSYRNMGIIGANIAFNARIQRNPTPISFDRTIQSLTGKLPYT